MVLVVRRCSRASLAKVLTHQEAVTRVRHWPHDQFASVAATPRRSVVRGSGSDAPVPRRP